jgi:hypothetical protein
VGFFKIGSCELFAWVGFKQWSSWSLPPEWLGLQAWPGLRFFFFFETWSRCIAQAGLELEIFLPLLPPTPQCQIVCRYYHISLLLGGSSTGVWTKVLVLARQVLYHLSHTPSPHYFYLFYHFYIYSHVYTLFGPPPYHHLCYF